MQILNSNFNSCCKSFLATGNRLHPLVIDYKRVKPLKNTFYLNYLAKPLLIQLGIPFLFNIPYLRLWRLSWSSILNIFNFFVLNKALRRMWNFGIIKTFSLILCLQSPPFWWWQSLKSRQAIYKMIARSHNPYSPYLLACMPNFT